MSAKKVGIVGGGQLGRMLALAGYPLGIACRLLDREPGCPGGQVAELVPGALDDPAALERLADGVDAVTIEIENVAVEGLEALARRVPGYPPPAAAAAAPDRRAVQELCAGRRTQPAPCA